MIRHTLTTLSNPFELLLMFSKRPLLLSSSDRTSYGGSKRTCQTSLEQHALRDKKRSLSLQQHFVFPRYLHLISLYRLVPSSSWTRNIKSLTKLPFLIPQTITYRSICVRNTRMSKPCTFMIYEIYWFRNSIMLVPITTNAQQPRLPTRKTSQTLCSHCLGMTGYVRQSAFLFTGCLLWLVAAWCKQSSSGVHGFDLPVNWTMPLLNSGWWRETL